MTLTLRAAMAAIALVAVPVVIHAQATAAVLPTATAHPLTYVGNCPVPVEFVGHITTTVPGTLVEYRWERSDGTTGKTLRATIGKAAIPPDTVRRGNVTDPVASDNWRLALPGKNGNYSSTLHILTPFDIRSAPAVVRVNCRD